MATFAALLVHPTRVLARPCTFLMNSFHLISGVSDIFCPRRNSDTAQNDGDALTGAKDGSWCYLREIGSEGMALSCVAASLEAPSNSSMKHSPTTLFCLMAIPVLHLTACSTVTPTSPTLDIVRDSFAEIRGAPARPHWPEIPDIDPEPLIGIPASAIRAALGHSDRAYGHYNWECGAPLCWVFVYDSLKPRPDPIVASPTPGLNTVIVTTGGPPLLILGITRGRVTSARWQGQK